MRNSFSQEWGSAPPAAPRQGSALDPALDTAFIPTSAKKGDRGSLKFWCGTAVPFSLCVAYVLAAPIKIAVSTRKSARTLRDFYCPVCARMPP